MKLYNLVKGQNSGANSNAISIMPVTGSVDSHKFVGKCMAKAEQLFCKGMSLDKIGTTFGVHFRTGDLATNKKAAQILVKIVKFEAELKALLK
jgi:hypothetical protein